MESSLTLTAAETRASDARVIAAAEVRAEHYDSPAGIGEPAPRISWTVVGPAQTAYELRVTDPATAQVWSTGRVESTESLLVDWPAPDLTSRARRVVDVRLWSASVGPSAWNAEIVVEAGLLGSDDWSAELITPDWDDAPDVDHAPALLRVEFDVPTDAVSARLYATAQGIYELQLNGATVGDQLFAPGWTSYQHRLRYQTYDVSTLLQSGRNALGATLADGWYKGRFGFEGGRREIWGDTAGLVAQLEITRSDGSVQRIVSDTRWRELRRPARARRMEQARIRRQHVGRRSCAGRTRGKAGRPDGTAGSANRDPPSGQHFPVTVR